MFCNSPQFSNVQVHVFQMCISINLFYTLMFSRNVFCTKWKLLRYIPALFCCLVINMLTAHCLVFVILILMAFVFEFEID